MALTGLSRHPHDFLARAVNKRVRGELGLARTGIAPRSPYLSGARRRPQVRSAALGKSEGQRGDDGVGVGTQGGGQGEPPLVVQNLVAAFAGFDLAEQDGDLMSLGEVALNEPDHWGHKIAERTGQPAVRRLDSRPPIFHTSLRWLLDPHSPPRR